ncbi:uncharacterized protein TNCV_1817501 [Trichonephila clavipes]|nr:uncharacterized protein TNCV_1817501 [Trichonephila clavipes]
MKGSPPGKNRKPKRHTNAGNPLRSRTSAKKLQGMGSNPREDRDVCKCIVSLWHGGTLNSRRVASSLVWKGKAGGHTQGFLPLNWGGTEQNHTITCMVLKAKTNDRCKNSSP